MNTYWAYLACIGVSLCYGIATVLEQVGAKKTQEVNKVSASVYAKFLRQTSYLQGLVLDLFGLLMILYALRVLPLFLVQSFIASSLIVCAIFDHYWLHTKTRHFEKLSIITVLVGLILLAIVARPGAAKTINNVFLWIIILAPILVLFVSILILKMKQTKSSSILLALNSGLSFGATSVELRIINVLHLRLMSVSTLLIISIIIYGFLAMFLLSVALQREEINRINGSLFSSQVIIPSALGLIFLGDRVANGQTWVMVLGLILVLLGTLGLSLDIENESLGLTLANKSSGSK